MNYKEKFEETMSMLLSAHGELAIYGKREKDLDLLLVFSATVSRLEEKLSKVSQEQKQSLQYKENEQIFENLCKVHDNISNYYFESAISRRKLFLKEQELLAANNKILELRDELSITRQMAEEL
jgi:hypothetical protein